MLCRILQGTVIISFMQIYLVVSEKMFEEINNDNDDEDDNDGRQVMAIVHLVYGQVS